MASIRIHTNEPEFNAAFRRFLEVSRKSFPAAVREEAGHVARALSSAPRHIRPTTPPDTRSQGIRRVAADIARAYNPLTQAFLSTFSDEGLRRRLASYVRAGNVEALRDVFRSVGRREVREFTPQTHKEARDSRGRVNRAGRTVTPDVQAVRNYTKRKQQNVGMARGAWTPYLIHIGKSVPGWLSRHANRGEFADYTSAANPSVVLTNRSPWAGYRDETNRVMAAALGGRAAQLAKRVQVMLDLARKKAFA